MYDPQLLQTGVIVTVDDDHHGGAWEVVAVNRVTCRVTLQPEKNNDAWRKFLRDNRMRTITVLIGKLRPNHLKR